MMCQYRHDLYIVTIYMRLSIQLLSKIVFKCEAHKKIAFRPLLSFSRDSLESVRPRPDISQNLTKSCQTSFRAVQADSEVWFRSIQRSGSDTCVRAYRRLRPCQSFRPIIIISEHWNEWIMGGTAILGLQQSGFHLETVCCVVEP